MMSDFTVSKVFELPALALGCMSLPASYSEAERILLNALDSGMTFFDTADLYQNGTNEVHLGKTFQPHRSDLILATKVGNQLSPDCKSRTWNPSREYILKAVEESLKRLRTDYIDLYQLHGGTLEDPWEETLEAFEILKSQGKIRAFGISSIRPDVIRKLMTMSPPATVMMQYSPLDRRPEETVFPLLEKTNTRVLVRGAFAKGILIDKAVTSFLDFPKETVKDLKAEIAATGFSAEAVLLRFGLIEKTVSSLVVGASSVEQIVKLQKAFEESQSIPDDFIWRLKAQFPKNIYQDHR